MNQWSQGVAAAASRCSVLFVSAAIALAAGCGNGTTFTTDPGDIDPATVPDEHACLMGATVLLSRYSSTCERKTTSVSSEVDHGVVFTSEQVGTLESPCDDGPAPGFEVVFDEPSHSVLLDFSNVSSEGRFPRSGFEGYMLDIILGEDNGTLVLASIDPDRTNLRVTADDIAWDLDYLEVNLEGVTYDAESQLALQLLFARVPPVQQ